MSKQLELVTGLVERVNDKGTGFKVGGDWLNVSAYHPLARLPLALVDLNIVELDEPLSKAVKP